jgi:hypothetical protein
VQGVFFFFFCFFFYIEFCDVAEVAIIHNISDLARFGYILDILEKKESIKVKSLFSFKKFIFILNLFFQKFQHLENQYN